MNHHDPNYVLGVPTTVWPVHAHHYAVRDIIAEFTAPGDSVMFIHQQGLAFAAIDGRKATGFYSPELARSEADELRRSPTRHHKLAKLKTVDNDTLAERMVAMRETIDLALVADNGLTSAHWEAIAGAIAPWGYLASLWQGPNPPRALLDLADPDVGTFIFSGHAVAITNDTLDYAVNVFERLNLGEASSDHQNITIYLKTSPEEA